MADVKVGGEYVDITVGMAGDVEWAHHWPVGSWSAKWTMDLPPAFAHPLLKVDAPVELMEGPQRVWNGVLAKPVYDGEVWQFAADGLGRLAERFLCLITGGATTTSRPDLAVQQAILRGLRWTEDLPTLDPVVTPGGTTGVNYLNDLLDAWTDDEGTRWAVDVNGHFYTQADPITPTLHLVPGVGTLGIADEDTASRLFGRYRDGTTTYATTDVPDLVAQATRGYREGAEDLTALGVITKARADKRLNGLIKKGATQPAWANGLEVFAGELTNEGGEPVHLPYVGMRPELVRLHGVINPVTNTLSYIDFPLGEVHHKNGVPSINVIPLGAVKGTTLRGLLTSAGAKSTGLKG